MSSSSSYRETMRKLSKSGELAVETYYRAMSNMTANSAIKLEKQQEPIEYLVLSPRPHQSSFAARVGLKECLSEDSVSAVESSPLEASDSCMCGQTDDADICPDTAADHITTECCTSQSQRKGGKMLSCLDQTMKMMSYHMGRISFECQCHFEDIPLNAMCKADKRHCRRFHKGLVGRKMAGEKRNVQ